MLLNTVTSHTDAGIEVSLRNRNDAKTNVVQIVNLFHMYCNKVQIQKDILLHEGDHEDPA